MVPDDWIIYHSSLTNRILKNNENNALNVDLKAGLYLHDRGPEA